jgi:hypothetical protein
MANHVNNFIEINGADEAQLKRFNEIIDRTDETNRLVFIFPEYSDEMDDSFNFNVEKVGAKWAHVEDRYDDAVNVQSAWSAVTSAVEYLSSLFPEGVYFTLTAEDEMPNWFGAYVFAQGEMTDYEEWDWDELVTIVQKDLGLPEVDYDEMSEDDQETFQDGMWETINELQQKALENMV